LAVTINLEGQSMTNIAKVSAANVGPHEATAFALAYAKWMKARGEIAVLDDVPAPISAKKTKEYEKKMEEAVTVEEEATWEMIRCSAESILDIRTRAEVTHSIFVFCQLNGEYTDQRHMMMLAKLVLDLQKEPEL
jgi:hypothetical protein